MLSMYLYASGLPPGIMEGPVRNAFPRMGMYTRGMQQNHAQV